MKKSQATMLTACACKNSRQLGPPRRGAGSSFASASSRRRLVAAPGSRAWPTRHRSAGDPSADSPARAATPAPEPPPEASAGHAVLAPAAISGERALDANAEASAEPPRASGVTSAAGGTPRPQAGPDRPSGVPAARPVGAGSRTRGAAPTARCLSLAGPDGYERARRATPAKQGRKRECHATDTPSPCPTKRRHEYWRPSGSKLFHGKRGWHRSGRLSARAQLLIAGCLTGRLLVVEKRNRRPAHRRPGSGFGGQPGPCGRGN